MVFLEEVNDYLYWFSDFEIVVLVLAKFSIVYQVNMLILCY